MMQTIVEQCIDQIGRMSHSYHRLMLVVGPPGSGKTTCLRKLGKVIGRKRLNVNLEISKQMLDLPLRERAMEAPILLADLLDRKLGHLALLDNLEILFHPGLELDPLRLFQKLSRNRTIVAAWNGSVHGGYLVYAKAGHPEYRRYSMNDLRVVLLKEAKL